MANRIVSHDPLQDGYSYELSAPIGADFDPAFTPDLTPQQMLELGVFDGAYFTENGNADAQKEFPHEWFANTAKNYFGVGASQSRAEWQRKGWIYKDDPRGWFQWYCRYYLGRRIPEEDVRQIKRWKAIGRHVMQIKRNCRAGDETCRPRQRQALLHWAYDSRGM